MENKKLALFFFHDPENIIYLAKVLIEQGWEIKAPSHNAEYLVSNGVKEDKILKYYWGQPNEYMTPTSTTIAGIRSRSKNAEALAKNDIRRIDLVCTDFLSVKKKAGSNRKMLRDMRLESTKAFLLMAAVEGGKIAICDTFDRKLAADWIKNGRYNEGNFMLRLAGSALNKMGIHLLDIGRFCDHLRK